MQIITSLTDEPRQRHQLILDNNETVDFLLYYLPTQNSWYFDFTYKEVAGQGFKVVLTPNSLRMLKRVLPFGLGFIADSEVEPFALDDFSSERIKLIILNQEEVEQIEQEIYLL